jgi:hypothetical protein
MSETTEDTSRRRESEQRAARLAADWIVKVEAGQ